VDGSSTGGSGLTVRDAIMICDLRDFTRISDNWPRDDVIDLLNDYFDAMSEPIERHGGELLKFIGDGLFAIFPLSQPSARANLLHAVTEFRRVMVALNERNSELGRTPMCDFDPERVGEYSVRGFNDPIEVFAYDG
jgi:adenylate cyclase